MKRPVESTSVNNRFPIRTQSNKQKYFSFPVEQRTSKILGLQTSPSDHQLVVTGQVHFFNNIFI